MKAEKIKEYCLNKKYAVEDYPFGELNEFKDDKVLLDMIDHSFHACINRLPKKKQRELTE